MTELNWPPKIEAPVANKADGSMQHSQEYNKLRWQNTYAIENGNKAAIEHYSKESRVSIKKSSLSTWKSKHYEEVKRLSKAENLLN